MTGILIAGFHRSGTSAVAARLAAAGVDLGDRLLDADLGNPHGHFEDLDVVELHDHLLAVNDLPWWSDVARDLWVPDHCWDTMARIVAERRAHHRVWAIKDPRVLLFVPLWRHVDPTLRVLVIDRSPAAVVSSLIDRHRNRAADHEDPPHEAFAADPLLPWRAWVHQVGMLLDAVDPEATRRVDFDDRTLVANVAQYVADTWSVPIDRAPSPLDEQLGNRTQTEDVPHEIRDQVERLRHRLRMLKSISQPADSGV